MKDKKEKEVNLEEEKELMDKDVCSETTDKTEQSAAENCEETDIMSDELKALQEKYDGLNDTYLRLMAEYDNYRKRTLKEKAELIKNGGERVLTELLPVVDDVERALKNVEGADDIVGVREGIELIYKKFMDYLSKQGVKVVETEGKSFDTEYFEAVAMIPAPNEDLKGKIVDCVQPGYTLNDRVIRHAKVIVGE